MRTQASLRGRQLSLSSIAKCPQGKPTTSQEENMFGRFIRILFMLALGVPAMAAGLTQKPPRAAVTPDPYKNSEANTSLNWQCRANWRHGLKKTSGMLIFNARGVGFQAAKGKHLHWSYEEIQTFKLAPHRFKLTGYQNREWHFHGERSFQFELKSSVPPEVAAQLARCVGKPVKDADPSGNAPAFATLGARHRTRGGGTNGVLRFRDTGIDYVTQGGHGERSWRWQDIQTIANPDPYHFRVGGYREAFTFELKQPMTKQLFDRLWNDVYARDLSGPNPNKGARP
jgi:hypothetical protein